MLNALASCNIWNHGDIIFLETTEHTQEVQLLCRRRDEDSMTNHLKFLRSETLKLMQHIYVNTHKHTDIDVYGENSWILKVLEGTILVCNWSISVRYSLATK